MKTNPANSNSSPRHSESSSWKPAILGLLWGAILSGISIPVSAQFYTPPSAGLVAWWSGEGNGNDSSGNGHNGTVGSSVTYAPGVSGQAFNFSTTQNSSRVYVPDSSAFQMTSSLSIAAWVYCSQPEGSGSILCRGDNRPGLDPYKLGFGAGRLDFNIASLTELVSANTLPLNQWVQVTATLDGSTGDARIYVNGNLDSEIVTTTRPFANLDPTQDPSIGIGNVSGQVINFPFLGYMDEVLLYSRALSPAEVAALAVVPEPSSMAILSIGAAGWVVARRRR